ncbi:MAG TPA: CHASE4 domain-containing protein [Steroidobacteraceae bacterium]
MNIRPKVIVLVAALFVILGAAELLVQQRILLPSFVELERTDAHIAMRRIQYALDLSLDRLALSATDWGNWADTYHFVQDHNRAFVDDNITKVALKELDVNAMLIVDLEGNYVLASTLDLTSDQPLDLDLVSRQSLPADFPWRPNLRSGRPAKGFVQTNRGILMLAAAPVLDGTGRGVVRGMVMMGRLLSAAEVKRIGSQAQAAISIAAQHRERVAEQLVQSDEVTHVYRSVDDVYAQPIMTLRVDVPRQITLRGRSAVTYACAYMTAAAIVMLILLVVILNRVILAPLARVTRHAVAIGADKDLTTRLDSKSTDEIGILAREFDRMVERVSESRRELVDQSFQAGFAELARGVLHNLGNAMTPIGVRLARLRDRLRRAPAENAEEAIAELAAGTAEPGRRADLEQFVLLACKELALTVKAAEIDIAVMSRQTAIVQSSLSEQMRATRNGHVIESVRLPELIAQSLEIVPDSCRQRLVVATDDSLKKVGVVNVARTVIRLILQNLIINAADAVREAGMTKGVLHVGAEIIREAHGDQLHLHCKDDGIGIAAANLERVFEKGFSTKSKATNYGIGLHWCANAIGALGGRLWATSDGPGHGASMHLLLPLGVREPTSIAGAA